MRAYIYDGQPGSQILPHDSGHTITPDQLKDVGVLYWNIPHTGGWEHSIDSIARERGYKNRDVITVTKEGLGDLYESKLKTFFEEHLHEDEEIRYILSGSGFFDVRDKDDSEWIRIAVEEGDLLVLPTGIYHRFTLDEKNALQAMRLFQEEPKWVAHNRGEATESNPLRKQYLQQIHAIAV